MAQRPRPMTAELYRLRLVTARRRVTTRNLARPTGDGADQFVATMAALEALRTTGHHRKETR